MSGMTTARDRTIVVVVMDVITRGPIGIAMDVEIMGRGAVAMAMGDHRTAVGTMIAQGPIHRGMRGAVAGREIDILHQDVPQPTNRLPIDHMSHQGDPPMDHPSDHHHAMNPPPGSHHMTMIPTIGPVHHHPKSLIMNMRAEVDHHLTGHHIIHLSVHHHHRYHNHPHPSGHPRPEDSGAVVGGGDQKGVEVMHHAVLDEEIAP